ncbi:zinc finger protein 585A [Elysia marginata]|uniref:Zinc finger protein 585A n=1 Tax=Elysia marginata TaxID=1093978 RepID=A0AAV4EX86_9GAST|nr:zinc finger protein 585A [Elysia marginata]
MNRWRRLKMLQGRFGTDTSSESESDLDSDVTSDGLCTDSGTESCNPAGLSTDPPQKGALTPKNVETAHSLSLQKSSSPHGVVRPSANVTTRTTDHRIVEINSKSYLSSHSGIASMSQSVPTERKVAVQIVAVTRQIVTAPKTDLSRVEKNQSKQVPHGSDSQIQSEENLEGEKVEPCSLCSLLVPCHDSDTKQQELIYHIGHKPSNCSLIFDIYQSLLLENLQFYSASLKVCTQCRMTFSVSADLLKHLYTHAVIKAKSVVHQSPASGGARFESVKSLPDSQAGKTDARLAMLTHNQLWPTHKKKPEKLLCEYCGLLCSSRAVIRNHIAVKHKINLPYKCSFCDKRFAQKAHANFHERYHKAHYCHICDKYIHHEYFFNQHMRVHELGEKPFKCDQCDKSFMRKAYLKAHQVLHTGKKPYQCSLCDRGFMIKKQLEIHVKTHTGVKEHKCSICSKDFFSKDDLCKHMSRHSKHHLCDLCGSSFPSNFRLKRHYKNIHHKNILSRVHKA